jgi:hypothetical protein
MMNLSLKNFLLLEKWAAQMGGVFSIHDLKNLFNEENPVLLHRQIKFLIANKVLTRFKKEFYVTKAFNIEVLAQKLYPDSYISLGTVLAKNLLIGSVPDKTLYSIKTGRTRLFKSQSTRLLFLSVAPHLYFGFEFDNGLCYAIKEKALIDTLYFYQKGFHFSFNIFEDIDLTKIDIKKVGSMLAHYKNPKFVTFVKGVLSGTRS